VVKDFPLKHLHVKVVHLKGSGLSSLLEVDLALGYIQSNSQFLLCRLFLVLNVCSMSDLVSVDRLVLIVKEPDSVFFH